MTTIETESVFTIPDSDFDVFALSGFMSLLNYLIENKTTIPDDIGEWQALTRRCQSKFDYFSRMPDSLFVDVDFPRFFGIKPGRQIPF